MNFEPLFDGSPLIQLHVLAASTAILLGPIAIWRRSRDIWHRVAGYGWVLAMMVTAVSSFWIMNIRVIGPFSPIHALSVVTLWSLWQGINAARRQNFATHQAAMKGLYIWALCVTGLLTLLPGRILNDIVLGGSSGWGIAVPAIAIPLLLATVYRKRVLPLGKVRGLF